MVVNFFALNSDQFTIRLKDIVVLEQHKGGSFIIRTSCRQMSVGAETFDEIHTLYCDYHTSFFKRIQMFRYKRIGMRKFEMKTK